MAPGAEGVHVLTAGFSHELRNLASNFLASHSASPLIAQSRDGEWGIRMEDVAEAIIFMLTHPCTVVMRDLVMLSRAEERRPPEQS